jgi:hypothetical protein
MAEEDGKPKRKLSKEARLMAQTEKSVVYFTDDDKTFADHFFLSTLYPCSIVACEIVFNCVEQCYNWFLLERLVEMYPENACYTKTVQTQLLSTDDFNEIKLFDQFTTYHKYCGDTDNKYSNLKQQFRNCKNSFTHRDNVELLKNISGLKFLQHDELLQKFLETTGKEIRFKRSRSDVVDAPFFTVSKAWFISDTGIVCNGYLGDMLMSLREDLLVGHLLADDEDRIVFAANCL